MVTLIKIFAVMLLLCTSPLVSAQCSHPQPDGTFIFTADTAGDCTGYWFVTATEYNAYLTAIEITLADVLSAFSWGMGTMVFFGYLGYQVRLGTTIVRKI